MFWQEIFSRRSRRLSLLQSTGGDLLACLELRRILVSFSNVPQNPGQEAVLARSLTLIRSSLPVENVYLCTCERNGHRIWRQRTHAASCSLRTRARQRPNSALLLTLERQTLANLELGQGARFGFSCPYLSLLLDFSVQK